MTSYAGRRYSSVTHWAASTNAQAAIARFRSHHSSAVVLPCTTEEVSLAVQTVAEHEQALFAWPYRHRRARKGAVGPLPDLTIVLAPEHERPLERAPDTSK